MPKLDFPAYLARLSDNRKVSLRELGDWLQESRLAVGPCFGGDGCDHGFCQGWRLYPIDPLPEAQGLRDLLDRWERAAGHDLATAERLAAVE